MLVFPVTCGSRFPLTVGRPKNRKRLAWIVAGVCLLGLLASLPFTVGYLRRAPVDERVLKVSVLPPEKATMAGAVPTLPPLSPDGRRGERLVV